jgi:GNAT superfamily N-acetyltransferase
MIEIFTEPAGSSDELEITRIMLDRKQDADPMDPEKHAMSLQRMQRIASRRNETAIYLSKKQYPDYFMQVAKTARDKRIVGYIKGAARLTDQHIWEEACVDHGGLMVDRNFESQGIAQMLEQDFKNWAVAEELPICVRVALGNERAARFFKSQGYEYQRTVPETETRPALDVLLLSYEALVATTSPVSPGLAGHNIDPFCIF